MWSASGWVLQRAAKGDVLRPVRRTSLKSSASTSDVGGGGSELSVG
jgi:hypothetical protein